MRAFLFHVHAFDWNCHQHITPRYTVEEYATAFPQGAPTAPAQPCDGDCALAQKPPAP